MRRQERKGETFVRIVSHTHQTLLGQNPAGRSEGRQSFTVGMRRGDNSIQKAKGRKEGPRKKEDRFVPIKEKNKYAQYNKRKSRPW